MKLPVFNLSSDAISATCAAVTLVLGLPATVISCWKAIGADQRADAAERLASEAKRAADAATKQAEIARAELVEARIKTEILREQLIANVRLADINEQGLAAAGKQIQILDDGRQQSIRLSDATLGQLRTMRIANEEMQTTRLYSGGTKWVSLEPGKPAEAHVFWRRDGRTPIHNVNMLARIRFSNKPETLSVSKCGEGNDWKSITELSTGTTYALAEVPAPVDAFDERGALIKSVSVYGAICYVDLLGRKHRTDFCSVTTGKRTEECPGVSDQY